MTDVLEENYPVNQTVYTQSQGVFLFNYMTLVLHVKDVTTVHGATIKLFIFSASEIYSSQQHDHTTP